MTGRACEMQQAFDVLYKLAYRNERCASCGWTPVADDRFQHAPECPLDAALELLERAVFAEGGHT